uniref:Eukaryotic translation initiation factor 5B n=1 Tax=Tetraselmis sp. GSL018 TaxID=582737 RepID=A0A061RKG6_9CHLO
MLSTIGMRWTSTASKCPSSRTNTRTSSRRRRRRSARGPPGRRPSGRRRPRRDGPDDESGSGSDSDDSDSDDSSYDSSSEDEKEARIREARARREARAAEARANKDKNDLRSPICCILGHVDTGKTKILDNIRRTNVQDGEAGGITQQIGATYVPATSIQERTEDLRTGKQPKSEGKAVDISGPFDMKMPGLLVIDTPGHESFTNLRARGSGLCDIAVLVVDMMHGMEQQTVESINLLKMRKTPFIVALNKIDRLYDWQSAPNLPIQQALAQQKPHVREEFAERLQASKLNLNEQGLNVSLYWENPDPRKFINIVPTSAITGEGIPDLLQLLVKLSQTMMADRLSYITEVQCTVLEVKVIEGLGTTVDVILVNGVIREGDTIVVCGLQGPIVTTIRSLLTPHPMKEIRVKGQYLHHKEVKAAQGIKIAAQGLENAVAGTSLYVVGPDDDVEDLKEEVMGDMEDIFSSIDKGGEGVYVQASTLGSLEALLTFLRSDAVQIPVSAISIGPVHKRDVMRAGIMLEKKMKKYGVILAFDVAVSREAAELADELGVKIMTADIIYHLFDQFTDYLKVCKQEEQEQAKFEAVFPCRLKIVPSCIFNKKDPIVLGVEVVEGIVKMGTPICVPSQGKIDLGRVASLEKEHKAVDEARVGDMVAMKLEATNANEGSRLYGRHFDHKDELVSHISRKSIDLLKENFRDEMTRPDWQLVIKLKKVFGID